MSADRAFAIQWTETALKLVEAISDQRIPRAIIQRADQLTTTPEQQGKARSRGQERRLRARQEAPASAAAPLTRARPSRP
jgi:hypothetical protein